MFGKNPEGMTDKLSRSVVAVAGCGGIGSNAAVSLVRAGIGELIIADMDIIEASNLNRQYFFADEIGLKKVFTLKSRLNSINQDCRITAYNVEIVREDVKKLFGAADILIEAFDNAESKQWLIEEWASLYPDRPVVSGNGLSGYGNFESIKIRRSGNIYFCGDGTSELADGLCSARVAIISNIQANLAIELLMKIKEAAV
ncbi:MAG TPA: sulfur carrier protein ThiS adenylyltransferase ThiF [Clostridiales bacterium]|nr:sulfur carrier protein ThiS adenylyltransferase ThiF [Clostridiales bacterium]HQP70749.1 sulfur carrier protein ThiS adenylyltransferase ThiF [Clostridiales bacterium]